MRVDQQTTLVPPDVGDVRDPARPILSFAWHATGPHRTPAHSHARGHVIHPESGTCWATTPEGRWLVPPGQAIWIPPLAHHEVGAAGPVAARVLFVDPAHAGALPRTSGTVVMSPLLSELLRRAAAHGNDYPPDGPAARLARVMLDELAALEVAPLLLPAARDPRLARIMERLVGDPGCGDAIEVLAREAGASARTLARLFLAETGMTFSQWRTRLRLVESVERLSRGSSVTEVAFDLGYGSTSSFVYMFRRNLGMPPGRFVLDRRAG